VEREAVSRERGASSEGLTAQSSGLGQQNYRMHKRVTQPAINRIDVAGKIKKKNYKLKTTTTWQN
jgi:hypothetical protein